MKISMRTPLITAVLLAALAGQSMAQSGPGAGKEGGNTGQPSGMREHMREHMKEHMASRHARHLSELKAKLKLDPQQEASWKTFADSMQMPAGQAPQIDHAALAKMNTPERIDQMQAQHARLESQMKQRGEATKAFYAHLNAEQKKTFDAETARFMGGHEGRHMHAMHPH